MQPLSFCKVLKSQVNTHKLSSQMPAKGGLWQAVAEHQQLTATSEYETF